MKDYSKDKLTEMGQDHFKEHPGVTSLFATSDGQFFLTERHQQSHALTGLACYTIDVNPASEIVKAPQEPTLSVAKLIESLSNYNSVDELNDLIKKEKAEGDRKSALAAIELRIAVLNMTAEIAVKTDVEELKELLRTAFSQNKKYAAKIIEARIAELTK